jgi:hypothetical protein
VSLAIVALFGFLAKELASREVACLGALQTMALMCLASMRRRVAGLGMRRVRTQRSRTSR